MMVKDVLTDLSGNENDGTIYGATWSDDVMRHLTMAQSGLCLWMVQMTIMDRKYPFGSIQHAVDAANDYDMVQVFSGEYFENIIINKNIHIGGNNEDGNITINGDRNGSVFNIDGGSDSLSVYLFGLRIVDGRSEKGAGVFINNANIEIVESHIWNNQTAGQGSQGGGVYALNSTVGIFVHY